LDFGAGREARHTLALRAKGYDITAHEVPENRTEVHDTKALRQRYDVVIMSNVINVQGTESMLRETLDAARAVVRHKGYLVVNFPRSPRYLPHLTFKSVEYRLRRRGFSRASLEDGVLIMQKGANR
jgi:hypothetical protein